VRLPPVSAVTQALQRVLPDGLQQPEARLAVAHLRPHQAAVHQRTQRVHDVPGPGRVRRPGGAAGLCGGQVEGSCKHPQAGEQRLLTGRQQVEAPVQSAPQRLLPLGQVARAAGQQPHPVVEPAVAAA